MSPEAYGALSLAIKHKNIAEWHYYGKNNRRARKHLSKMQKLEMRAKKLEEKRQWH